MNKNLDELLQKAADEIQAAMDILVELGAEPRERKKEDGSDLYGVARIKP